MKIATVILTLIWFCFGFYLCKNKVCAHSPATQVESSTGQIGATGEDCNSTLVINDSDGGLDISSSENFQFLHASEDLLPPTSDMIGIIDQLADHLSNNSGRFMEITGLYLESETNDSEEEGLGEARAASVRSYLISKGIQPAQLTLSSKMDNDICTTTDKILKGIKVSFNEIPAQ